MVSYDTISHLSKSVDDLLVGQLDPGSVSRLVVHVETEHLPVSQVHLSKAREGGEGLPPIASTVTKV